MTNRSISAYTIDDDDNSNIDLEALDSDSLSESQSSSSQSLSSSNTNNNISNFRNINNANSSTVKSLNTTAIILNDNIPKPNYLSHIQSNKSSKSNKSKRSNQISFNHNSLKLTTTSTSNAPLTSSTSKFPMATRQSTYNSTLSSTNDSRITGTAGTISNIASSRYHNGNDDSDEIDRYNDYLYAADDNDDNDDFYNDDYEGFEDDEDDDTYSYDYIANVKLKKGDKLKTSWAMPIQNESQYKDLQIIDEVSKLQNLNFFSKSYVESLENLKIAQLGLLIDMVKLSENSFDEFYSIWNDFENKIKSETNISSNPNESNKTGNIKKPEVNNNVENNNNNNNASQDNNIMISSLSSELDSISPTRRVDDSTSKDNSPPPDINKNDKVKDKNTIENTKLEIDANDDNEFDMQFDINNSEGFTLMKKRKEEILSDLEKINSSIDQIDAFTKSMWTKT